MYPSIEFAVNVGDDAQLRPHVNGPEGNPFSDFVGTSDFERRKLMHPEGFVRLKEQRRATQGMFWFPNALSDEGQHRDGPGTNIDDPSRKLSEALIDLNTTLTAWTLSCSALWSQILNLPRKALVKSTLKWFLCATNI